MPRGDDPKGRVVKWWSTALPVRATTQRPSVGNRSARAKMPETGTSTIFSTYKGRVDQYTAEVPDPLPDSQGHPGRFAVCGRAAGRPGGGPPRQAIRCRTNKHSAGYPAGARLVRLHSPAAGAARFVLHDPPWQGDGHHRQQRLGQIHPCSNSSRASIAPDSGRIWHGAARRWTSRSPANCGGSSGISCQNNPLFSGSVRDNIALRRNRLGRPAPGRAGRPAWPMPTAINPPVDKRL